MLFRSAAIPRRDRLEGHYKPRNYSASYSQLYRYYIDVLRIKEKDSVDSFKHIILAYVVSKLNKRRVQVRVFRTPLSSKEIFIVEKEYFSVWLKALEKVYLGMGGIEQNAVDFQ